MTRHPLFFLWRKLTMALSLFVSLFIPVGPLMMAFSRMTTTYMADRGKLKLSLSDNEPWRKSDFCGMGKGDVITLTPFLSARLTLEIRQELHLITKMLFKVTVMWKTVWEMLKVFPMVKGWSPLVVKCVAWVMRWWGSRFAFQEQKIAKCILRFAFFEG